MTPKYFDFRAAELAHQLPPPPPDRVLVARYWLPLACAPTANLVHSGIRGMLRRRALALMQMQHMLQAERWRSHTLPLDPSAGKPLVRCWRFSSVEPDGDAGWSKIPVDRLLPRRSGRRGAVILGLGLIVDDRPSCIDREIGWTRAKRNEGAVLIEVWV